MRLSVQTEAFDLGAESNAFAAGTKAGAVVTFTGIVRDNGGTLSAMQIEHYPGMTERAIAAIMQDAITRWTLTDALVIHRHGLLKAGEPIMMVAFAAAEFLMDYLKSRAPFWKKEIGADGAEWVAAKDSDEDALKRW
jgi:molybdopterin synthase catalytic subunit